VPSPRCSPRPAWPPSGGATSPPREPA
jgi:hypothetical protein